MTLREAFVYLRERSKEMGKILGTARRQQGKSLLECANYIGTSRRRYTAIEHGDTPIQLAEMELLIDYLNIPLEQIWPMFVPVQGRQVVVTLEPGEMIHVLVKRPLLSDDRNQA